MQVQFFLLSKRINSTKLPGEPSMTLDCQLENPTDTVNPTIVISPYVKHGFNYVYIPTWQRYYFVNKITYNTGSRMEVSLTTDYLTTYRTEIAAYSCFVERASTAFNPMIDDEYVSNTEDVIYRNYAVTQPPNWLSSSGCYVIRTISGGKSGTGITSYVTNEGGMLSFLSALFDPTKYGFLSDEVVKSFFNPFQYVVSVMWMPVQFRALVGPSGSEKTSHIYCGWWDTGEIGYLLGVDGVTLSDSISVPNSYYDDFRKISNRFSHYTLFLPGVGTVDVGAEDVHSGLGFSLYIDALTGHAEYVLNSGSGRVATFKTQLAVPIQIGQVNSGLLNMTGGLTQSIVSGLSGNIAGVAGGLINAAKSTFNPTTSINGANGDKYTIQSDYHIVVAVEQRGSGQFATSVAGRPLHETRQLSTLVGGFIKCGNASIDIGGYDGDKERVNEYLNSGFYLE